MLLPPINGATILASKTVEVSRTIRMTGECYIEASAAEGVLPKVTLMANTGVPMDLDGFPVPVVIDMEGAKFEKSTTPIIADHDTTARIGHSTEQLVLKAGETATFDGKTVSGPLIAGLGVVSSGSATAKEYVGDAKAGFPFQVSVGATIVDGYLLEAGEKAEVNGRQVTGPVIVAAKSVVKELTITVLGADSRTSATLAARLGAHNQGEDDMTFEQFVESLGFVAASLTEDQRTKLQAQYDKTVKQAPAPATVSTVTAPAVPDLTATRKAEADDLLRRNGITAALNQFGGRLDKAEFEVTLDGAEKPTKVNASYFAAHAIETGMAVAEFELACHRQSMPEPSTSSIITTNGDLDAKALECAILRDAMLMPAKEINAKTGKAFGYETLFDDKVLEASEDRRYRTAGSIQNLLSLQLAATGDHFPSVDRSGMDFMAAVHGSYVKASAGRYGGSIEASGFSTLNVVNVLENALNKSALAAFTAAEGVWSQVCGRRPLNDFRPHNMYQLEFDGAYRQVAVTGELKHVSMADRKRTIQADTYGAMITLDRKTLKNDDLGMILDFSRGLGLLGAQRIEESVFVTLLANGGSFFSAGNGNLITGASTALSVDSLETARQSYRNQVINGKPVSISPSRLLVGTTLETTARRLWAEERLAATGDTDALVFTDNQHKGLYQPIVTPYLNNTSILDQDGAAISGQSATQWYLFADPSAPQGAMIVIGFIDGRSVPYFDEAETQFNTPGGIQFRSYLDWGVALNQEELGLKSAGA